MNLSPQQSPPTDSSLADEPIRHLQVETFRQRWDMERDIAWNCEPDGGLCDSLFDNEMKQAFGSTMDADVWELFKAQQQAWMVSQFLEGEQGALSVSAKLVEKLPDSNAKLYCALQVEEEARHVMVFQRYQQHRALHAYMPSSSFSNLLGQLLASKEWDMLALGMHVLVEGVALSTFRLVARTGQDPLLQQIALLSSRDEARHVSFGGIVLRDLYSQLSDAERSLREEFVLEAASVLSQRYLLTEIWTRLGIDSRKGNAFCESNSGMRAYRKTLFNHAIRSLKRIGLMTSRVQKGFADLGLANAGGYLHD